MSALADSRSIRAGALLVIAVLALGWLLPVVAAPPRASASVVGDAIGALDSTIDTLGSAAGDAAGGVAGVAGDVAGVAAKGFKGAVKGVSTVASWSTKHAGPVIAALAAAGTWVACSKVTKAVATGAGAAAGTPADVVTGPGGTVAGAAAGLAAAEAVCKVVKTGGKFVLKVGKKAVKNGGKLSRLAKLAATATGIAGMFYGLQHAASWVLNNLLDLDGQSGKELASSWLAQIRSDINAIGLTLLVLLMMVAAMGTATRGPQAMVEVLRGVVWAAMAVALFGAVLYSLVAFTDAVSNGMLHSTWGQRALGNWRDFGDQYAGVSPGKDAKDALTSTAQSATGGMPDDGKGPWFLRMLIAFFTVLFGILVWIEMQVREAGLILVLLFSGLVLVAHVWPRLRSVSDGFQMLALGIVLAKLVIVATLLVGGALMQSAAAGDAENGMILGSLQGLGIMAIAGVLGWWLVAWLGMHSTGGMAMVGQRFIHGGGLLTGGASGGGGPSGSGGGPRKGDDGPGDGGGDPSGGARPGADTASVRDLARGAADRVGGTPAAGPAGAAIAAAGGGRVAEALANERRNGDGPRGAGQEMPNHVAPAIARPAEAAATGHAGSGPGVQADPSAAQRSDDASDAAAATREMPAVAGHDAQPGPGGPGAAAAMPGHAGSLRSSGVPTAAGTGGGGSTRSAAAAPAGTGPVSPETTGRGATAATAAAAARPPAPDSHATSSANGPGVAGLADEPTTPEAVAAAFGDHHDTVAALLREGNR